MSSSTQLSTKTIRQLREERGWTQGDVAVRLRVSQTAISHWELGLRVPQPGMRQRLAGLFGVSASEIAFKVGTAVTRRPQHRSLVATFLMKRIECVQPGQEAELDTLEQELDDWLRLNDLAGLGESLRQQIVRRRAELVHSRGNDEPV